MSLKHNFIAMAVYPVYLLATAQKKATVGGQSIIEGVMMRGRKRISWAVRTPKGEIALESSEFKSLTLKYPILRLPILRGAVSLFEALSLGLKALSRSAELSEEENYDSQKIKPNFKDSLSMFFSITTGLSLSFLIFMYLPMKILTFFVPKDSAIAFNLWAGGLRIVFFLAYLGFISLWKDVRRLFEYHGAEHKAIFAFENNQDITVENMKPYTTLHPRCGTSFLLITALVCVFIFAVVDTLIIHFIGSYPNILFRTLTHFSLMPFVGGMSYEFLRFSGKHSTVFPVNLLIKPGLLLQKITTSEPDDNQMMVAAKALEAVL